MIIVVDVAVIVDHVVCNIAVWFRAVFMGVYWSGFLKPPLVLPTRRVFVVCFVLKNNLKIEKINNRKS